MKKTADISLSAGRKGRELSILYITPKERLISGGAAQFLQLAQGLTGRGHRVTLVTRPGLHCRRLTRQAGVTLKTLPLKHSFDFSSMFRLYRLMRAENTEVVHVQNDLSHLLAYFPFLMAGVPVLVVNRGVSRPLKPLNRIRYCWKKVGIVVAVAEEIRRFLITGQKLPPEKVVTIYGGTDLERFDWRIPGTGVRQEFDIPDNHTVIGMIANIRPFKGHRYFLEAVYPLLNKYADVTVLIVGEDRNELAAALKREALGKRIIFTGYREDIPRILAALDFSVISSYEVEGLTGSLRESLAMKKPVISARVGGNAEIVEQGVNGLLVPFKDVPALEKALEKLITDPGLRKRLGERGRELIERKFSLAARLDRIEALYYRLVDEEK
ncbi:MAG: glycosyltransferase family 4 protein [bacterium]